MSPIRNLDQRRGRAVTASSVRGDRYKGVVFLVEQEDRSRARTEAVLENCGYLVLTARDGVEALARMRGLTLPAVAVIELNRARGDGPNLIAAMRADDELHRIPVIAMSAASDAPPVPVERSMRRPFALTELVEAVGALLTQQGPAAPRTSA
jgi:CheY-like chemotaxis protein